MEKTAGLCRLGKSEIDCYRRHRHSPHAEFGIIGDPAYWRLCRGRHNRHRFATWTLVRWYRAHQDPERKLPILSAYLGHVHVADTQWYLSGSPELMREAMRRLERRWEDQP